MCEQIIANRNILYKQRDFRYLINKNITFDFRLLKGNPFSSKCIYTFFICFPSNVILQINIFFFRPKIFSTLCLFELMMRSEMKFNFLPFKVLQ